MIAAILCALLLATHSATGSKQGRVVSGLPSGAQLFPSMARLHITVPNDWCGGNLFTDRWILTAAHCLHKALSAQVGLGGTDRLNAMQVINVTRANMHIHPNFNALNLDNDIALIQIPPVTFTDYINQIPLASDNSELYSNMPAFIAGWGRTSWSAPYSPVLLYAGVKVIDNYEANGKVCIDTTQLGSGTTCRGDSGGPLAVINPTGQVYLIGVTSSGNCVLGSVACFTRISTFLPWIQQVTGGVLVNA